MNNNLIIRLAMAVVLLAHSIPPFINGGIFLFGEGLNEGGFAPLGVPLAWAIKLSHLAAAGCLIANRYLIWAGAVTIFVLVMGIILVHWENGWFVVGAGSNGIEFNFLLIFVWLGLMFPYLSRKHA